VIDSERTLKGKNPLPSAMTSTAYRPKPNVWPLPFVRTGPSRIAGMGAWMSTQCVSVPRTPHIAPTSDVYRVHLFILFRMG
jgi:hypothetical protein